MENTPLLVPINIPADIGKQSAMNVNDLAHAFGGGECAFLKLQPFDQLRPPGAP